MALVAATTREFGGSMLDFSIVEEDEEDCPRLKESKGLLRRAFSSKKRKKKSSESRQLQRGSSMRYSPRSISSPHNSSPCICYVGGRTVSQGELCASTSAR